MWLYLDYEPVAAFGLRPSNTTSNGGKSLLCPTPYAIKMALLDRLIRQHGLATGESVFPLIRDLIIHIRLPLATSVNRTFQRVLRAGDMKAGQWIETISQREYCFQAGALTLAVLLPDDVRLEAELPRLFSAINYFGRRGSFMQLTDYALIDAAPDADADFIDACQPFTAMSLGFLQRMDNMQENATFEDISVMNPRATGGRISYTVIFPYQLVHHGSNHTVYALKGYGP